MHSRVYCRSQYFQLISLHEDNAMLAGHYSWWQLMQMMTECSLHVVFPHCWHLVRIFARFFFFCLYPSPFDCSMHTRHRWRSPSAAWATTTSGLGSGFWRMVRRFFMAGDVKPRTGRCWMKGRVRSSARPHPNSKESFSLGFIPSFIAVRPSVIKSRELRLSWERKTTYWPK